jgi:hypothetical protein
VTPALVETHGGSSDGVSATARRLRVTGYNNTIGAAGTLWDVFTAASASLLWSAIDQGAIVSLDKAGVWSPALWLARKGRWLFWALGLFSQLFVVSLGGAGLQLVLPCGWKSAGFAEQLRAGFLW